MIRSENRLLLRDLFRVGILILMIGGVLFLYLLQRIRSREQSVEISRLAREKTALIKRINRVEYEIERIRRKQSGVK